MLRLILDEKLVRFSSVVRAVDVLARPELGLRQPP